MDECCHNCRKYNRISPVADVAIECTLLAQLLILAPHVAVEVFRDVEVVNHSYTQKEPPITGPHHKPQNIDDCSE